MIKVDRREVNPPKILTDPKGNGAEEIRKATEFYTDLANREKTFPFEVYKAQEVKQALNQLFHFKCAYCETVIAASQPVAVEHYRPKGAVVIDGKPRKPGYYWLAAVWDNLLPSCTDCNSPRQQDIIGEDAAVAGKASKFPIANEAKRATAPGGEKKERRLLLNPCLDDPEKHLVFEFIEDKNDPRIIEVIVVPAKLPNGKDSPMGKASIQTYALQRSGLVMERSRRFKDIKAQVARINKIIKRLDEESDDQADLDDLKEEMEELNRLIAEDQEYVGMARQYVKSILGG
jgi:uncharacterized protein (TIGR02646 family)